MDPSLEELLRRLAINDERALHAVLGVSGPDTAEILGAKTTALVRLAGLLSVQSSDSSLDWTVSAAVAAGASDDEIVAVIAAVSPIIGSSRTSCGLERVCSALGVDVKLPT